tara:strand:- start:580 stop:1032 length:453 start_codon:yes stop_codon:yes gene_type:complete
VHIGKQQYEEITSQITVELQGDCLLLAPKENLRTPLPPLVETVSEWPKVDDNQIFNSILSIGSLASAEKLSELLQKLRSHSNMETRLYFCDRTIRDRPKIKSSLHDITGALWEANWSVIKCGRFTIGENRHSPKYAYGIARVKRSIEANL